MIRRACGRSTRSGPLVRLLAAVVAAGGLVGCTTGMEAPRDAVAVFDGGWVSAEELAAAASGERAGTSRLPGVRGATQEELARWIAWEELVAADRRNEVDGRRDFSLRVHELQQESLVSRLLAELGAGVQVSDAEVSAELEAIRASRSAREPRLELRHIYLRASDELSEEERERKRALARQHLEELRGGASFEELARQHSESSTAPNGGLIPALRPGMTDPSFERVVFALDENEISDVIETASGFHIVLLVQRTGPEPVNEEALREQLPETLRSRKTDQARAELVARLRETEPHETRWTEAGLVEPRASDGVVLVVRDFVFTGDDFEAARAQAGVGMQRGDQIRAFLDGLLGRELLAGEARRRFRPDQRELAALREQAVEETLRELAVSDEEAELEVAIPRAELERFAAEQPAQLEVAATYRPQVIFLPDGKNVWETFREAEQMVAELRGGADFAAAASERSTGPNADRGGDLGLLTTNQMMAYDLEMLQVIVKLEIGEIYDPIRVSDTKLSTQVGSMKGGFLIVRLLERREPHPLDLEADEAEIRRRFWSANRNAILRQRRDERLLGAGFGMLLQAGSAFAEAAADPQS